MKHEEIRGLLGEWIDGELGEAESAEVAAHAAGCAECRRDADRLRRLGPALFRAAAPTDPRSTEAFVARVMSRVEAGSVPAWERFASRWLTPALGLALAGLAAGIWVTTPDTLDLPLEGQLVADVRGALPYYDDAGLGAAP